MSSICSVLKTILLTPRKVKFPINQRRCVNTQTAPAIKTAEFESFANSKKLKLATEIFGAGIWWCVLWYLWDQYDTLAADYFPDPRAWMRYKKQFGIPVQDSE